MAVKSSIERTESTWNPVTGRTTIGLHRTHYSSERMVRRLQAMGPPNCASGFRPVIHEHMLGAPLRWNQP